MGTVDGLTNGVQTVFWVRARNSNGPGESSGPVSATPRTLPGAPGLTSATGGQGMIEVEWTAPESDGGGDLTGYLLRATPDSGPAVTGMADPQDLTGTIHSVPNGKTYEVTVAAVNDAGTGPWSGGMDATTIAPDAHVTHTNLPVKIHVGSAVTPIPLMITLDEARSSVQVVLQRSLGAMSVKGSASQIVASRTLTRSPAGMQFSGTINVPASGFQAWGAHQWRVTPESPSDATSASVNARAHSLLGLSARRVGDWVYVTGSARAYHSVLNVYKPWNARPVELERWNGSGWTPLMSFTTDTHGNLMGSVRLPWKAGLRLSTPDTASIWGASSMTAAR